MRWQNRRRSSNIEDRRGQRVSGSSAGAAPLLRLLPMLLGRKGGKWVVVIIGGLLVASYLGVDIPFLSASGPTGQQSAAYQPSAAEQELAEFTAVVLADTEETWGRIFSEGGGQYQEPTLVMFNGAVNSACGRADSAMGPFYCPADRKVYIDLSFYQDLKNRHNAPGDFAQAYVIAHEVGHHVQTLLGISPKVREEQARVSKSEANELSVRQELQADCFAGVWGYSANKFRDLLEPGDLEEALVAASAIGDDRLQQDARGYITPESFTHGTSQQRVKWFKRGFSSGDMRQCDTFSGAI
ncbi:neutral zinc metallopeptidase [Gilvimarinus xylanilyticus]|uniref:Zinc metallopeptidase n=1 Tax=Gilvimarinus xylanilyticus TaxID=2944139 RepID=A0A9X2I3V4_9GAMM|nr:neutral zinc metallopeptidase [Gilvimarinus xylanilyticus]MCP8899526.1 zinc metallopeptidase [Gilvimarinus xylanilyticus]